MQIVEGGVCVATKLLLGLRYVQRRKLFLNKSFEFSKLHSRILNWKKSFSGVRCYYFDMYSFAPGPGETITVKL